LHRRHRVVVRSGAAEPHGQYDAARSGFGQYPLVGEEITALWPQLIGGVADERGQLALAQHAYRLRRVAYAVQVLAEGGV
jgi:hypothetical protein